MGMKKLWMILPLALIMCFAIACQENAATEELENFKTQAALEEQNEAFVKRFYEEMNNANTEIFKEMLTPDFRQFNPSGSSNAISRDQWLEAMANIYKAFPDFHYDIQDIFARGDKVVVRTVFKMTHIGDWYGIPATGNKIEVSEIFIIRIQDGKIAEEWGITDRLAAYLQLGMELRLKKEL